MKLLTPWLGPLPSWYERFKERMAASEPEVVWEPIPLGSWERVCERAFNRTGLVLHPSPDPRKICELRPLLATLYPTAVEGFDWWGWCDFDCVFGDLRSYFNPEALRLYDLVTDHARIVNGPLTIMRSTLSDLWREHPRARELLESPEYTNFDEDGRPSGLDTGDGGFTRVVHEREYRVRVLYLGSHYHDRSHRTPVLLDDGHGRRALFHEGREIVTYHFTATKRWPL